MVRYLFYTIGDLTYQSPLVLRFITFFISACNWSLSTAILNQHTSSRHYKIPLNISVQSVPESSMLLSASADIFEYISHLSYVSPVSN